MDICEGFLSPEDEEVGLLHADPAARGPVLFCCFRHKVRAVGLESHILQLAAHFHLAVRQFYYICCTVLFFTI